MGCSVDEQIKELVYVGSSGKTVSVVVYDESQSIFASDTMAEVGATGIYEYDWTPDAVGVWLVVITCSSPIVNVAHKYHVGMGQEGDEDDITTDTIHGKLGTDTELGDRSLYDLLIGDGPTSYPSATAPANDVSLAEVVRYIVEKQLQSTDGGDLTHDITTGNDTSETQIFEMAEPGIYDLAVGFDLDVLETAGEGGTVTFRLYNKVDGSNYPDIPNLIQQYVVGSEIEYPSLRAKEIHGECKVTIQCSTDVMATRTIAYRRVKRLIGE